MTTKLRTKSLYKVFGEDIDAAISLAREGVDKDEIFSRTGSVVAVDSVDLSADAEEIFVVMGLSGSGKSTLVRCINRLIEPSGGTIEIDGDNIVELDEAALREMRLHKVAMVFQHFALFPHRTVAENVAFGLKIRGVSARERREKAIETLAAVGLEAWADSFPDMLSGGMQQRVGLARALAVDPQVLLMDEPFSALDPLIRRDMQQELLQIQERFRATIVFITHDLNEALHLGNRIAIMKDGRFVQVGAPAEIVGKPADDYVASFTQDVDRSRVLTVGSLARRTHAPLAPDDQASDAMRALVEARTEALLVCDEGGKPVGAVTAVALLAADGAVPVERIMNRGIVTTGPDTPVHAACDPVAAGLPVAVVDRDGRLTGSVDPSALLEVISGAAVERPADLKAAQ